MSGDEGDFWRDVRVGRQQRHASNRDDSAELLRKARIDFTSNNGGAHLVVRALGRTVDFWPGTGRWIPRDTKRGGYGVRNLIAALTPEGQ